MASSNRHWPSMFKSKPCNTTTATTTTTTNTTTPQWQHDINHACLMSSSQRPSPYSSSSGCEERSPEPKPRWNPKPEQIRILETIFNSGLVNPPRDEIRRIRSQLQEYGQVGDANVFYWFQNRKSRSKHKQKHLQNTKSSSSSSISSSSHVVNQTTSAMTTLTAPSSCSSSSSEKSSPPKSTTDHKPFPMGATGVSNLIDVSNSPTSSVNQLTYFQSSGTSTGEFTPHHDPAAFYFPVQQTGRGNNNSTVFSTQGFCFSELANVVQFPSGTEQSIGGPCSGLLLSEFMLNHGAALRKEEIEQHRIKFLQQQLQLNNYTSTIASTSASTTLIPTTTSIITTSVAAPISSTTSTSTASTTINQIQGVGESDAMGGPAAAAKSTVFINDVAIEISVGPLNVRQTFGDDVVLIHPSGQPVLTNEWGVTLHSLTPGAFYYLVPMSC